jgi:hypothetical protein
MIDMEIILALVIVTFAIFTASFHTVDAKSRCEGRARRDSGALVPSSMTILSPGDSISRASKLSAECRAGFAKWLKPKIRTS